MSYQKTNEGQTNKRKGPSGKLIKNLCKEYLLKEDKRSIVHLDRSPAQRAGKRDGGRGEDWRECCGTGRQEIRHDCCDFFILMCGFFSSLFACQSGGGVRAEISMEMT